MERPVAPNDNKDPVIQIGPYLGTEFTFDVGDGQMSVTVRDNENKPLDNAKVLFALYWALQIYNRLIK